MGGDDIGLAAGTRRRCRYIAVRLPESVDVNALHRADGPVKASSQILIQKPGEPARRVLLRTNLALRGGHLFRIDTKPGDGTAMNSDGLCSPRMLRNRSGYAAVTRVDMGQDLQPRS